MPTMPNEQPEDTPVISPLVLTTLKESDIFHAYRAAQGIRPAEMARELNVSRQRLNNWLNGVSIPEQLWVKTTSRRDGWVGDLGRDLLARRAAQLTADEVQG